MRYSETTMTQKHSRPTSPIAEGSSSWVRALTRFLGTLGIKGGDSRVVCDIDADGAMHISDLHSGARYRLSESGVHDWSDPENEFNDDPTTGIWDAPTASKNPAYTTITQPTEEERELLMGQAREIQNAVTTKAACELALDVVLAHVPAESGSILLAHGVNLQFAAVRGPRAEPLLGMEMPSNQGIAGLVAGSGTTLMVRDARATNQHYGEVDERINYQTQTMLAVPIHHTGHTFGVLEILNPFGGGDFAEWHQTATQLIGEALGARLAE